MIKSPEDVPLTLSQQLNKLGVRGLEISWQSPNEIGNPPGGRLQVKIGNFRMLRDFNAGDMVRINRMALVERDSYIFELAVHLVTVALSNALCDTRTQGDRGPW